MKAPRFFGAPSPDPQSHDTADRRSESTAVPGTAPGVGSGGFRLAGGSLSLLRGLAVVAVMLGAGGLFPGVPWVSPAPGQAMRLTSADVSQTDSFSEVLAIKSELTRLRLAYIQQLRRDGLVGPGVSPDVRPWTHPELIPRLEFLAREFVGTGQSAVLDQLLLIALRRQQAWDRWLERYLGLAYRQPMSPLVSRERVRAIQVARDLGREDELNRAFRHLEGIPARFATPEPMEEGRWDHFPDHEG